jgi:hypothetical protein
VRALPAQCIGRVGVGDGPTSGRFYRLALGELSVVATARWRERRT